MGSLAARWRGSRPTDSVGGTLVISSIPYYVSPAGLDLPLLSGGSSRTPGTPVTEDPARPSPTVLPWLVLGVTSSTDYARFTRGQMVETLGRGLRPLRDRQGRPAPTRPLFKHALRAAIVPIVTIFGLDFATLLSGTVFTEKIFGIDGIGHWG